MQSFSFMPLMASEKKIFEKQKFKNLAFRLPWQPIKISNLDKIHMAGKRLLQKHFCKTFFQNICSNTEINANFHFFHYKSMETLSCHSNESTWAMTIKKHNLCRGLCHEHVCKVSASSPLRLLRRRFLNIFLKINPLCCHGNQSNSAIWTKFI